MNFVADCNEKATSLMERSIQEQKIGNLDAAKDLRAQATLCLKLGLLLKDEAVPRCSETRDLFE